MMCPATRANWIRGSRWSFISRAIRLPPPIPPTEAPATENDLSGVVISFYPDGTADAGDITLRDREGFRLLLHINPVTARIHVIEMEREAQP